MNCRVPVTQSRIAKLVVSFLLACGIATLGGVTAVRAVPFQIYESSQLNYDPFVCNCYYWTGQYTVINNTSDWVITGFQVTNPFAGDSVPSVFIDSWKAEATETGYFSGVKAFSYYATNELAYLGPGSYSDFFWGPPVVIASDAVVFYQDALGASNSIEVAAVVTPLPAALPLFAAGLGVLGLLGWRRNRRKGAAPNAARSRH
jgi:hypothetical protein